MAEIFWEYRKAQPGDVKCSECVFSRVRWWSGRLECTAFKVRSAVGKNMTCRSAAKRIPPEV